MNRLNSGIGQYSTSFAISRTRLTSREINQFTRDLSIMLKAGMMLLESLRIIRMQDSSGRVAAALQRVETRLENGSSFADALRIESRSFSPIYINLVEVGELGGNLAEMLQRLSLYQTKIADLKRKLMQAMTYPALVVSVAICCVIFLLIYVVPTFQTILTDFGGELPWITRFIISMSDTLQENLAIPVAVLLIGVFLAWRNRKNPSIERISNSILLHMPWVGKLIKMNHISQFCRTLGTLLNSGVSLLQALDIASRSTTNNIIREHIVQMKNMAARGERLTHSLQGSSVFPLMVAQMIAVGEETAELPSMLLNVSDYYDRDLDSAIETLGSVIEPVVIIILGLVIGVILISIYLPLFNMTSVIG